MFKVILSILILLIFISSSKASTKDKIILNLKNTENMTFNFEQTINDKTEKGQCTIEYPKKIYCSYSNKNKKIMVSTGKSLVIKNKSYGEYYIYPLKKTPLELILDKNYLI
jgi:outer membrane lipoprotein-sorting protein